ncbi:DNA ligase [Pluteus cervinus]|uniref:DNA ligase n=1 Tax=Pluteus cervinus TaxID=181527 RepID=A0ACD3ASY6_9AGAR|nr:DNA ligase [Pluteus cervinus]
MAARSGPSPSKRSKTSSGQPRIEQFFHVAGAVKVDHLPSGSLAQVAGPVEIIDVDLFEDLDAFAPSRIKEAQESIDYPLTLRRQEIGVTSSGSGSTAPSFSPLDVDPLLYDPESQKWSFSATPYALLSHAFVTLARTRSRNVILNCLTNVLRTILVKDPNSLLPALYLLSNSLGPPYESVELGIGPSVISQAIQQISGLSNVALKKLGNSLGDPGDVAFAAKSKVRTLVPHAPLLIPGVYKVLLDISQMKGSGATKQKQNLVSKLLLSAHGEDTRYLVRTLSQNLRVGAVRTSMLVALARAVSLTPPKEHAGVDSNYYVSTQIRLASRQPGGDSVNALKSELVATFTQAEKLLRRVYVKHPSYEHIATGILTVGLGGLENAVALTLGIPLHPTLGSPMRSLDQIYNLLGDQPFSAEFKYDGQRAQIHGMVGEDGGISVKIFSRHLEDMTSKYPDIIALVEHLLDSSPTLTSFILDSEIVAIDPETDKVKSFQELSNRARKNVQLTDIRIAVGVYAFDVMYLNGQSLLEEPFRKRRGVLRSFFLPFTPERSGVARLSHVESCESAAGREAIIEFWEKAVGSSCEGLMIKLLDGNENIAIEDIPKKKTKSRRKPLPATYEPDKRTAAWLKLKKDYVDGIGDSFDLVPIGAWHGSGRKAEWWSPVLLALWDPESGQFVAICKCMSGFTDAFYKSLNERYSLTESPGMCSKISQWECSTGGYRPDVYFKPSEVWEIRGADITLSPISVAARGNASSDRGLSIRFPRFIRAREDKSLEQASNPDFLVRVWKNQQSRGTGKEGNDEGDLLDVDLSDQDAASEVDSDDLD